MLMQKQNLKLTVSPNNFFTF